MVRRYSTAAESLKFYSRMKNEIGRLVDTILDPMSRAGDEQISVPHDVYVENDMLVIELEVPGLEKEKITITAAGKTVEVTARKDTVKKTYKECHTLERENGDLRKTIRLERPVDITRGGAVLADGLLKISFPVVEEKRRKRTITIQQEN